MKVSLCLLFLHLPAVLRLLSHFKKTVVTSSKHGRPASVPRNDLTESPLLTAASSQASSFEELMDLGESTDRFAKQSDTFKLPPKIDQSIFRSNTFVNVHSSSTT